MTSPALPSLGDEKYVSLTTFRSTGVGVPTPVWVVRDGDALLVTTTRETGKVKRIRRNPSVELRPCSRSGTVDESVPPVTARAEVLDDDASRARTADLLLEKYGLPYRLILGMSRLRRSDVPASVTLRITSATS